MESKRKNLEMRKLLLAKLQEQKAAAQRVPQPQPAAAPVAGAEPPDSGGLKGSFSMKSIYLIFKIPLRFEILIEQKLKFLDLEFMGKATPQSRLFHNFDFL